MEFQKNSAFENDAKYNKEAAAWQAVLKSIEPFGLSETSLSTIATYNKLHAESPDVKVAFKNLQKANLALQQSLVKNDKLFRKNYNRDVWIALGVGGIGVGLGAALGSALGSMAYIGLGMPIGMLIGILIGRSMDQKAEKEGRVYSINS
jgi:thiamine pyrophosphate-dependent acetolactate synthase large subunit-like protein